VPAGTAVYFRLYTNGSNTTTGTTAIGRSALSTTDDYALSIEGSAAPVQPVEKIIAWQFAMPQKAGSEASIAATSLHNGITATNLVRGAGLNPASLARSFVSLTTVASSVAVSDTAIAIGANMYYGFSVTPLPGKKLHLSGLDYKLRISGGGARVWYWKYSVDGVNFSAIANPIVLNTATAAEGNFMPHISLSEIPALQNIGTTVYFRLYTNGSNTTTGSSAIGRSAANSVEDVLWLTGRVDDEVAAVARMQPAPVKSDMEVNIVVAKDQLNVALASPKAVACNFALYDMQGRQLVAMPLQVAAGANNFAIPVNLHMGMYIASVQPNWEKGISKKVMYRY
jgi:hypothetical protein